MEHIRMKLTYNNMKRNAKNKLECTKADKHVLKLDWHLQNYDDVGQYQNEKCQDKNGTYWLKIKHVKIKMEHIGT